VIDQHGEGVLPDLWFYYGVRFADVLAGRGPSPYEAMLLVQRLPDDSLTAALMQGGREFFGWGRYRHMLADVFDALNLNTRATGNWKNGKAPGIPPYPRPHTPKKPQHTVKDIYRIMQGG
jgi:hypothetical protein